jgi:hypothetical protein
MAKHIVKQHFKSADGLTTVEHQFDSYDEAFLHAESSNAQKIQLFSPTNVLLSERENNSTPAE